MHHSPIIYLAKFGAKGVVIGGLLFVGVNPVTWGVGLALFDHYAASNAGARFLGHDVDAPVQKRGDRLLVKPPTQSYVVKNWPGRKVAI